MERILINDTIDISTYLEETEAKEKVKPASNFIGEVLHQLSPAFDEQSAKMPFSESHIHFRKGEVTLWAGYNGSGKSMLQGQVMATFAKQKYRCCIASFEMKPPVTLARITKAMLQNPKPQEKEVRDYLESVMNNLWLYDQQGTVESKRITAVIKYCAEVLKIEHFAIDSLMKCVRGEDDYNGQKDFVDEITAVARDYGIHIHLVHHMRKGESEQKTPTKMDIKGTGAITDLVDNILIVYRNKKKEKEMTEAKTLEEKNSINNKTPDAYVYCEKNRNGNWEGVQRLWYSALSNRFDEKRIVI